MQRILTLGRTSLILLLLLALGILSVSQLFSQSFPSKKNVNEMLQKAVESVDLDSPGNPSFHLAAHVYYSLGPESWEGKYELLHIDPGRYKEEFQLGDNTETDIALKDKVYIVRNTPTLTLPLWSIRKLLRRPVRSAFRWQPKPDRIYQARAGTETLVCTDVLGSPPATNECFDPQSGAIRSLESASKTPWGVDFTILREFVELGNIRFPRFLSRGRLDENLELHIDTFETIKQEPEDALKPDPSAEAWDWCTPPRPEKLAPETVVPGPQANAFLISSLSPDSSIPVIRSDSHGQVIAYYVVVGVKGNLEKAVPLRQYDGDITKEMEIWARHAKIPVRKCGGRNIRYEMVSTSSIFLN